MRSLEQWLDAYGESHQNSINQKIHTFAVPGIFFSIVALIWSLPSLPLPVLSLNWVWVAALPVWWFYYRLSLSVFLMMLGYTLASIALAWSVELLGLPLAEMAVGLFIVLWIFQFVGHKIEGRKPSFFEDLKFLLIGPVWVFMRHK
ncbi:Mpo1 family 2-hydroxy fatty acid dioxygenase [Vibrio vulnificus]|uniref:Mpo1 family 2-hydroxy fatty acid dioxygenase n=1 Tax=Vibrio vulnificus TaxID=672 RepID=UPI004057DF1C